MVRVYMCVLLMDKEPIPDFLVHSNMLFQIECCILRQENCAYEAASSTRDGGHPVF